MQHGPQCCTAQFLSLSRYQTRTLGAKSFHAGPTAVDRTPTARAALGDTTS